MSADFPLAILAKAPIPGETKTRLIPVLGAEGAARLHAALLCHTLKVAINATAAHQITLWTALDHSHPLFLELADRYDIELRAQPEGDLGDRMHRALSTMKGSGLLIGSDCPALTPTLLAECHDALEEAEVVLLPAEDGGYGLVGVRHPDARLFQDIAWGTAEVMTTTRQRIDALGWRLSCPARVWDVDRPQDLQRLALGFPRLGRCLKVE
ncbi:TIGR04282 family arsenosugar biosynthesis glycosyltransferase [Halomonas sp. EGI 63088]|uniref:TIGR04282 family arsenosugar biosynthesis glycosyltransferase n=1 Tax=Halomonas flagellata TaxID=2920385 RepID=A0ABS9RRA7_9GAMM|nr:TIGR04282 family arsenosugar biosynthesis glycosyltransferase [Halomonas flagellata]MCH4562398.1 TIGR04282 family arsenosugar biosynthesis glycosyltransferase [Halomonas flagellata]